MSTQFSSLKAPILFTLTVLLYSLSQATPSTNVSKSIENGRRESSLVSGRVASCVSQNEGPALTDCLNSIVTHNSSTQQAIAQLVDLIKILETRGYHDVAGRIASLRKIDDPSLVQAILTNEYHLDLKTVRSVTQSLSIIKGDSSQHAAHVGQSCSTDYDCPMMEKCSWGQCVWNVINGNQPGATGVN